MDATMVGVDGEGEIDELMEEKREKRKKELTIPKIVSSVLRIGKK